MSFSEVTFHVSNETSKSTIFLNSYLLLAILCQDDLCCHGIFLFSFSGVFLVIQIICYPILFIEIKLLTEFQ